jgi:hypothetical protein
MNRNETTSIYITLLNVKIMKTTTPSDKNAHKINELYEVFKSIQVNKQNKHSLIDLYINIIVYYIKSDKKIQVAY